MSETGTRLRKRIFLNLDGTGQSEYTVKCLKKGDGSATSPPVSNIARIGRATLTDDEQLDYQQVVYYQAGVGASSEDSVLALGYQGLTGTGLVQNVREAYGFLCNNYDFGDEIYITGFSRGAFTARSVAGMIGKVGILTKKGLDLFYEAFDYYEHPKDKDGNKKEMPVSEAAGTTRMCYFDPSSSPKGKNDIKIKVVGVFDTVGALTGDWAFHDVKLDNHIEHAFHVLALNEKRRHFEPTLWESSGRARPVENFEQCWMAGDHSNIGGSWPDQQLADLSLAWMMSRYGNLGVKFNPKYLYDEYVKYKTGYKQEPPTNPRQWGEGKCEAINDSYVGGIVNSLVTRKPMMYEQPQEPASWTDGWWSTKAPAYLQNTNETVHANVRYRHFRKNPKALGQEGRDPYNPSALDGWTWPAGQADGRVGQEKSTKTSSTAATEYSREVAGKKVTMQESVLGTYEKILLALYDQDPLFKGDGERRSVWKEVVGGEPPREIRSVVAELAKA